MKKIFITLSCIFSVLMTPLFGQQTPGPAQNKSILITGVTAHIGNGELIENAAIGFNNGIITFIGKENDVDTSTYDIVQTEESRHVYPGFIAANTTSGLVEIDAVRATNDIDEVGLYLPHIRSLIAYNTESKVTESLRPNGVLMGQITPRGGTISGTSSVVQFDAWNWEDAAIKIDDGIHINWPSTVTWSRETRGPAKSKNYVKSITQLKTFLKDAKTYLSGSQNPRNLTLEATKGLFSGEQRLFVHVGSAKGIIDAINISKELGIENIVIVHGSEAHKVADILVENNIPVIIDRTHRLPSHNDQDVHYPYKMANDLTKLGVVVAIGVEGQMERMNSRNLPFYAGTCAAYGLDKEEALKLITSNTAKILGIDDVVGTLEVGKHATLFISEGDALDMRTNKLINAYIQGRALSLETHQTELYQRYMDKYNQE